DLIFRFKSIERIVPHQSGDLRLQIGTRQPLPERGLARLLHLTQPALQFGDFFRLFGEGAFLFWRRQEQGRRREEVGAVVGAPLVDAVEERPERVIVLLGNRVVLVVVTAATLQRQAEEGGAEGVDAVGDILVTELLRDTAALAGHAVQPRERRRQALLPLWPW